MSLTRSRALALIGAAPFLARCGNGAIRVGSKNFGENVTLAEVYAAALEDAGILVERHMFVGDTAQMYDAISNGRIHLYPEYLGTGLVNVLRKTLPLPDANPHAVLETLQLGYRPLGLKWLNFAAAGDSQALAMTRRAAHASHIITLSQCSRMAPRLRLVAPPDFFQRPDGLKGLQAVYPGGFMFKNKQPLTIGLQYDALVNREADVALVFTSSPQIGHDLILLKDDLHFWPPYNIAPVVRLDVLRADLAAALNRISARLTPRTLLNLNANVIHGCDPALVARQFVKRTFEKCV